MKVPKAASALALACVTLAGCAFSFKPVDLAEQVPQGSQLDPNKSGETFLCLSPKEMEKEFYRLRIIYAFDEEELEE